jgi:hypothetical protein
VRIGRGFPKQNATDNPAAAKKCRFQETPDPPLGFIGLFVGVLGAVLDSSIVEACKSTPSWMHASSHNALPITITVNPSSANMIATKGTVTKIATVIIASPEPRTSIPNRSIQSRPFPQLGIQAASAK